MSEKEQIEALLKLRSKLAFEAKTKHSWSFSDDELKRLVIAKPRTLDALGELKGFPREGKRVKAYGQLIIDIFNGIGCDDIKVEVLSEDDIKVTPIRRSSAFCK